MRFHINRQDPFAAHRWFAWHPVFIGKGNWNSGTWIWMETIYRRARGNTGKRFQWAYVTIEEMVASKFDQQTEKQAIDPLANAKIKMDASLDQLLKTFKTIGSL